MTKTIYCDHMGDDCWHATVVDGTGEILASYSGTTHSSVVGQARTAHPDATPTLHERRGYPISPTRCS